MTMAEDAKRLEQVTVSELEIGDLIQDLGGFSLIAGMDEDTYGWIHIKFMNLKDFKIFKLPYKRHSVFLKLNTSDD